MRDETIKQIIEDAKKLSNEFLASAVDAGHEQAVKDSFKNPEAKAAYERMMITLACSRSQDFKNEMFNELCAKYHAA